VSNIPHWVSGPAEVLAHGFDLLKNDSDTNRRLAMISIDNSVELAAMTYITLPKRVSGLSISRKQREEYVSSFPSLMDALDEHATKQLTGINLGEIEWFHRLRNELYHQGNGLTVELVKVEAYAQLAIELFKALFEIDLQFSSSKSGKRLGEFLELWIEIEKKLVGVNNLNMGRLRELAHTNLKTRPRFDVEDLQQFDDLRALRNKAVHGQADPKLTITDEVLGELEELSSKLKDIRF
jgi:hypothetical protein